MSSTHIPASWLLVRYDESIRIFRPSVTALLISGPGHAHIRREFVDDAGLESYLTEIAATLDEAGWFGLGEGYERRRNKRDRWTAPRLTADRRREA